MIPSQNSAGSDEIDREARRLYCWSDWDSRDERVKNIWRAVARDSLHHRPASDAPRTEGAEAVAWPEFERDEDGEISFRWRTPQGQMSLILKPDRAIVVHARLDPPSSETKIIPLSAPAAPAQRGEVQVVVPINPPDDAAQFLSRLNHGFNPAERAEDGKKRYARLLELLSATPAPQAADAVRVKEDSIQSGSSGTEQSSFLPAVEER